MSAPVITAINYPGERGGWVLLVDGLLFDLTVYQTEAQAAKGIGRLLAKLQPVAAPSEVA